MTPAQSRFATPFDLSHLLQRCRSPARSKINFPSANAFKWAVQGKKSLSAFHNKISSHEGCDNATAVEDYRRYGLALLQRVEINEDNTLPTEQPDDIVFAFSLTLVELRITARFGVDDLTRIGGGGLHLPFLSFLDIRLDGYRLDVDQSWFSYCRNLIAVVLSNDTHYNDCKKIEPYSVVPLESLTLLVLCG